MSHNAKRSDLIESMRSFLMPDFISLFELKKKVGSKRDFYLVEALSPERFAHSHLPGAINIPAEQVEQLAPQMIPDKAAEIVTYCANPK